jgi:hypothetical protein
MKKNYIIPQLLEIRTETQKLMTGSGPGAGDQKPPSVGSRKGVVFDDEDEEDAWEEEEE